VRSASAHDAALRYLTTAVRPWPAPTGELALVVTAPATGRVAIYDNALTALVMLRAERANDARKILAGLARLQAEDGSLPFSFVLPRPDATQAYVRSGALAWVGYAAVEYLDASQDATDRTAITAMGHRLAAYLLAHQVDRAGDPRDGLITGGAGTYRYELGPQGPREVFAPGEIAWAATEHNIDAFFFLHALARLSGQRIYRQSAERIGRTLTERGWNADSGQLVSGFHATEADRTAALDCASWGALFLAGTGARTRAETAAAVADRSYQSMASPARVNGHKPYVHKALIDSVALARHYAAQFPQNNWDDLEAVWPEGSAGVALAALRVGAIRRAREILDGLEPLRRPDGSLPTLTAHIPFEFDVEPSVGGTAWVELTRYELDHAATPRLWRAP